MTIRLHHLLFILLVFSYGNVLSQKFDYQESGLTSKSVYLSDGNSEISKSVFSYGEKFYVIFSGMDGFIKTGDFCFPGMNLNVQDANGEIVLSFEDLYSSYENGIDISPLELSANLRVADPLHSNQNYKLNIHLYDKKGSGNLYFAFKFNVVPSPDIRLVQGGLSSKEVYLFSGKAMIPIVDNFIEVNETMYLLFEGTQGFTEVDGQAFLGISLNLTDANGEIILDEKDLVGEQE